MKKKAELLKAELSNALNLEAPESTHAPDASKSVDIKRTEATPLAEPESPFKRKKIPHACEIAYQKHQETLKKREQLEQLSKQWHKKYDELLAHEPTRTQRIFAKIGLGAEKIERYDLELARAKKALSDIEHNKTVYQKILGDKNSLALIEQYNAIVGHNAKLWEAEAQALLAHSQKLERERELKEEQEREQATPAADWTVGCDPTQEATHDKSNCFSLHM